MRKALLIILGWAVAMLLIALTTQGESLSRVFLVLGTATMFYFIYVAIGFIFAQMLHIEYMRGYTKASFEGLIRDIEVYKTSSEVRKSLTQEEPAKRKRGRPRKVI